MKRFTFVISLLNSVFNTSAQITQSPGDLPNAIVNDGYTYTYSGPGSSFNWYVDGSRYPSFTQDGRTIAVTWTSTGSHTVEVRIGTLTLTENINVTSGAFGDWTESNGEVHYMGNVGIGKSNPAYQLDVAGTSRLNLLKLTNREVDDTADSSGEIYFDENYYHDYSAMTNNGGGIAIKTEDGWGAIMATNNMEWITANFRGLQVNNLTQDDTQDNILVSDANGNVYFRDASSISGGSSYWDYDPNNGLQTIYGVDIAGSLEVSGVLKVDGYIETDASFRGTNFMAPEINGGNSNNDMNIFTERGSIVFEIDRNQSGTTYNVFQWKEFGNPIMILGEQGNLLVGGYPTHQNPWAQLEVIGGTMRIDAIQQEPTSYDRILSIDETGMVFFKDATTITGSIDPTENIDFEGVITIGNPSLSGTPTGQFYVNGPSYFTEINVEVGPWPDYVFLPDYELRPLEEVYSFIQDHGHLPEVPSAEEIEEEGMDVAEMNAMLLKKVEELTLYQVQLLEMLKKQQAEIDALKADQK